MKLLKIGISGVREVVDEEASSLLARKDYYKWVYQNKEKVEDFSG